MSGQIKSNVWSSAPSCPINENTIQGLLQLTGLEYELKPDTNRDVFTLKTPPSPFSELEWIVNKFATQQGQFVGKVGEVDYAQAKSAQQRMNNWLAGKVGCVRHVDLGEPWEKTVQSKMVTFRKSVREFLFNLTTTYGHGIEKATPHMVQQLQDVGVLSLNVDDGALVLLHMPAQHQYYLQKSILSSLKGVVHDYMDSILDKIAGPVFSIESFGTFIGQNKSELLQPLIRKGYAVQRIGNELRLYKVMSEGKAILVQYHLESGVILWTDIGGVKPDHFLGLEWIKQDANRLFSQSVVSTGLNTKVPAYAYDTPTPLSYILAGVKQAGLIESYQVHGNFGVSLATANTISALSPAIGYIFNMEETTLKIYILVSCMCDTDKLFSHHLIQLDASIAYFCGTCNHQVFIENI